MWSIRNIFIFLALLSFLTSAQLKKEPPFIISVTHWERLSGIWGSWITAQQNNELPPMYFVCGISLQQMIWKKNISSGCPSSCSSTLQTFKSMVNAVKITYCRYNDWNKQIQRTFETFNTTQKNGAYKQYKCPRDSFVTKATSKFSFEYETDLGLTGFQFVCENINLNENSVTIEDQAKAGFIAPVQSPPKYGYFMSAIILKYEVNGKLTGINFGYSGVPVISKLVFEYGITSDTFVRKIEETSEAENQGSKSLQILNDVNKTILIDNFFANQNPSTHEYDIDKKGIIDQYEFLDGMLLPDATRQIIASNFTFNSIIQSKKQISQHLCIQVGPCKKVQIITQVNLNKAKTIYTVALTFSNRLTGELIGVSGKLQGAWTGTLINSIKSKTQESDVDGCTKVSSNLTTE